MSFPDVDANMGKAAGEAQGQNLRRPCRERLRDDIFVLWLMAYVNLCPDRIYWLLYREKAGPERAGVSRRRHLALANGQMEIVPLKSLG